MKLDRVLSDAERGSDVAVGASGGELLHHLELAVCQGLLERFCRTHALFEHSRGDLAVRDDEVVRDGVQCGVQAIGRRGTQQHRSRSRGECFRRLIRTGEQHHGRAIDVVESGRRMRLQIDEQNVGIDDAQPRSDTRVDIDVTDEVQVVEPLQQGRQSQARETVRRGHGNAQGAGGGRLEIAGNEFQKGHCGYYPPALKVTETSLPGVLVIEPGVHADERGFFLETYHLDRFRDAGIPGVFVQDNHSRSRRGVLRGLHYQEPKQQGKLVRCSRGTIFDVAVDIRAGSPRFGHWFSIELDDRQQRMLWVPPGFAHGFCALTDDCDVTYKCTGYYDPPSEQSILWNDPDIGIRWPVENPSLSAKDAMAPRLKDAPVLPSYRG